MEFSKKCHEPFPLLMELKCTLHHGHVGSHRALTGNIESGVSGAYWPNTSFVFDNVDDLLEHIEWLETDD